MNRRPTKKLGDLLKIQNGFAFRSEFFNDAHKGLPIIRIRDLARGFSETFCNGEQDPVFEVANGDFLIGMDGEFRCYRWQGGKALLNQRVCRLHSFSPELNASYVFYGINEHLQQIEEKTAYATVKHLSTKQIAKIEMSVPPLEEQKRLVKLLDEADELRGLRAQADSRTTSVIPALFHEMFGDPAESSKGYPVQQLENVCSRITDGTHQPPHFSANGIPFLFVRNIVKGIINFDTEKFITEETFAELTRRVKPERGDILYSTVGSYGVAVQIETDRKFAFQRHIGHLKPNRSQIDSGFLAVQLNTPFLKSQADKGARGIAQKTVNLAEIRKFKILVPPLPLQKEFTQRVSEIKALEIDQAASRHRLDDLFQSLLHRAFNGELLM